MLTPRSCVASTRRYVIAGGMTVSAAGFVLLALVDDAASPLAMLVAGSVVFSLGLTPVVTLTTDIVLSAAPPERAGAASALSETSSEFGGALGIAVMGSVVTAIYRGEVDGSASRGRTSGGGRDRARHDRRRGIGRRTSCRARSAPRFSIWPATAFAHAFGTTAAISAVIALGVAVLAAALLRRVPAHALRERSAFRPPRSER